MWRTKDVKTQFTRIVLLTTFTALAPTLHASAADFELDRLPAFETETTRQRCEVINIHEPGSYWLVIWSDWPSTAPPLMVLATEGTDPRTVRRVEAMRIHVIEPGEHIVCRTSEVGLGRGGWDITGFGNPLEIEELIAPTGMLDGHDKSGDPLEIEELIDP